MRSKIALHSFFGQSGFYLVFILTKNKSFQSVALLKIFPSSPSMEKFSLDMQK